MFVAAGAASLLGFPWVWAKMINTVQNEDISPASLRHLLLLLLLPVAIQILFWVLTAPRASWKE